MAHMVLANIEPGTTEDEIRSLLVKYGFPPFDDIVFLDGDGSRPAAGLVFRTVDATILAGLQQRLHRVFWKNRVLSVTVAQERFV